MRASSILKFLFLSAASVASIYGVVEVILVGFCHWQDTKQADIGNRFRAKMQADRVLGYRLASNLREYPVEGQNYRHVISTDSLGFRNVGRDYSAARTAFFGDSFTEPEGVDDEWSFHRLLEYRWREGVVSFAVSGWALDNYHRALEVFVDRLDSVDDIVYVLYSNDFSTNGSGHLSYTHWLKYWEPQPPPSFSDSYSRHSLLSRWRSTSIRDPDNTVTSSECEQREIQVEGARLWLTPRLCVTQACLDTTERLLLASLEITRRSSNAEFSVLLLPSQEYVWSSDISQRCPDQAVDIVNSVDEGHGFISSLGHTHGFRVFDASPALLAARAGGEVLFIENNGHLTKRGHKVVADYLVAEF